MFCGLTRVIARADVGYGPPFILLQTTNTWRNPQTFNSSTTFNQPITVPSCVGCGGGPGGSSGDNFGSHIATQPITAGAITASSGTVISSFNVQGVVTSTTGFIGESSTFTSLAIRNLSSNLGGASSGIIATLGTGVTQGISMQANKLILLDVGSPSAPPLAFVAGQGMGMYSDHIAANRVGWTTSGKPQLTLDQNGSLGIGGGKFGGAALWVGTNTNANDAIAWFSSDTIKFEVRGDSITFSTNTYFVRLIASSATITNLTAQNLQIQGAINIASNPVDWSQLKNVPGAFANGTISLDTGTLKLAFNNFASTVSAYLSNGALSVYDEGGAIGNATTVNCVGAGITCTQSGSTTTLTVAGGAGGGASSLAVGTGSVQGMNIISSPTAIVAFSSGIFLVKPTGSATSFVSLDPSSVTLQGDILSIFNVHNSTNDGILFAISAATTAFANSTQVIVNQESPDVSNRTYYLTGITTGTQSSYLLLGSSPAAGAESSRTQTVTSGGNLVIVSSFITTYNDPLATLMPAGIWSFTLWANVSSLLNPTNLVVTISTASDDGSTVREVLSATSTAIIDLNSERFDLVAVQTSDIILSTSDRIVFKVFGKSSSIGGINVTLFYGGATRFSHLTSPLSNTYRFTQLADTPNTFVGKQGKYLSVNNDQTSTVWVSSITDAFITHSSTVDTRLIAISNDTGTLKAAFYTFASTSDQQQTKFVNYWATANVAISNIISTYNAFVTYTSTADARLNTIASDTGTAKLAFVNYASTVSSYLSNGALAVYDESGVIGNATTINCTGSAITCSQSGSTTTINVVAGAPGGGGASSLAVGTGSVQGMNIISSPTANISFSSGVFFVQPVGGATAYISLDYSSVTAQGDLRSDLNKFANFLSTQSSLNDLQNSSVTALRQAVGVDTTTLFTTFQNYRSTADPAVVNLYTAVNSTYTAFQTHRSTADTAVVALYTAVNSTYTAFQTHRSTADTAVVNLFTAVNSTATAFQTHRSTADTAVVNLYTAINSTNTVFKNYTSTVSAYLSGGALSVYEEGTQIGNATTVNCVGAGITCSQSGSTTTVTVSGGAGAGTAATGGWVFGKTNGTVVSSTISVDGSGFNKLTTDGVGASSFTVGTSTLPYIRMCIPAMSIKGRAGKYGGSDTAGGLSISTNPGTTNDSDAFLSLDYFTFAPSTRQYGYFQMALSSGGTNSQLFGSTLAWNYAGFISSGASAGGQVSLALQLTCLGGNANIQTTAWGSSVTLNLPNISSNFIIRDSTKSAAITPGGTCFGDSTILGRVSRNAIDGRDNLGGATGSYFNLTGIGLFYRKGSLSQDELYAQ